MGPPGPGLEPPCSAQASRASRAVAMSGGASPAPAPGSRRFVCVGVSTGDPSSPRGSSSCSSSAHPARPGPARPSTDSEGRALGRAPHPRSGCLELAPSPPPAPDALRSPRCVPQCPAPPSRCSEHPPAPGDAPQPRAGAASSAEAPGDAPQLRPGSSSFSLRCPAPRAGCCEHPHPARDAPHAWPGSSPSSSTFPQPLPMLPCPLCNAPQPRFGRSEHP